VESLSTLVVALHLGLRWRTLKGQLFGGGHRVRIARAGLRTQVSAVASLVLGAVLIAFPATPATAALPEPVKGYLNDGGIPDTPRLCGLEPGAKAFREYKLGNDPWIRTEFSRKANKKGCVQFPGTWTSLAPEGSSKVSFRIGSPKQTVKRKGRETVSRARESKVYGPYVDVRTPMDPNTPVAALNIFGQRYGTSTATIICTNPYSGEVSQGSAVSIPFTASPNDGSQATYLATAAHVVEGCSYEDWKSVEVLYEGQTYAGQVHWTGYQSDYDVASINTDAPIPPALMGSWDTPQVGQVAISIATPSGIVGTVTEGTVAGISRTAINLTTPSGPGASGGPVFNNRGEVLGLVIAGNGSLTVAQAIPTFCGTLYTTAWAGCQAWPDLP